MFVARQIRNIALIGLMGAGKSTVGRIVAERLRFDLLDTDRLIEHRAHMSVSDIFAHHGEAYFRELEREVVRSLERHESTVIATGGGLGASEDNLTALKSHALVVYLRASAEKLFERVRHSSHRPLLKDTDPLGKLRSLLEAREPVYRQADVLVSTDWRTPWETAQHVVAQYRAAAGAPQEVSPPG